ncbi:MAG TPA: type I polyketide synthase, partial [Thermoanaerobaculia bacterium]
IASLAEFLSLAEPAANPAVAPRPVPSGGREIAIVAVSGRFPGAVTTDQLWRNLLAGVESITHFSEQELLEQGIDPELVANPNYIKAKGILGGVDQFDAAFFGHSPRSAELTDPQHRVFLECAWEALEIAGYDAQRYAGRIGVFAGQSMNTYWLNNLYYHIDLVASVDSLAAAIGNDKDSLTTEVSYRMNLKGPSVLVQSSSSTSLTAVHYACQSLLAGECEMALAGGVSIHLPERSGYLYHEGGTTDPEGHCRTFDADAKGFVSGHGAGVVVLKRLADALRDGDTVLAVIKGSACNNDGSHKVSYMAPSVDGHAEVVAAAQAVAGVAPDTITYLEAHGTGTLLGDPIEVAALTQAFRAGTDKRGFCALGSLKTNIGHLDTAAGVAGLIKTALCLHHKQLPAILHFQRPNPKIDFAGSPFFVNTELRDWTVDGFPRRAGVSSLGMGGTNTHMVLEEAPEAAPSSPSRPFQLLLLSAKTETALETATSRLSEALRGVADEGEAPFADVAYTLQVGRGAFAFRRMLVADGAEEAADVLGSRDPERLVDGYAEAGERPLAFLFSGQGAQYPDMGRGLYATEEVFREEIDRCAERLLPHLGLDLRGVLYPG